MRVGLILSKAVVSAAKAKHVKELLEPLERRIAELDSRMGKLENQKLTHEQVETDSEND